MGWSFENAAGTALDIDDGSTYSVRRYSGVGLPPIDPITEHRPGVVGTRLRQAGIAARTLTLNMRVEGDSQSDTDDNVEALIDHLAGSYGRREQRVGTLTFTTPAGASRALKAIGIAGMSREESEHATPTLRYMSVTMHAAHPNWYNPSQQSTTGTIGTPGSLSYPFSHPFSYGPDGSAASITVSNAGSAETQSLEWRVPGPSTGPSISSQTVSRSVRFRESFVVPTGLTLVVRMGWQPDEVSTFKAVMTDDAGVETNVLGQMISGSRRMWLDPGSNAITVAQVNEAATVHTLRWYAEYLGA